MTTTPVSERAQALAQEIISIPWYRFDPAGVGPLAHVPSDLPDQLAGLILDGALTQQERLSDDERKAAALAKYRALRKAVLGVVGSYRLCDFGTVPAQLGLAILALDQKLRPYQKGEDTPEDERDPVLLALSHPVQSGREDALREAEQWLRAISDWLLANDYDMKLPGGILDNDPLDIADRLAALTASPPAVAEQGE